MGLQERVRELGERVKHQQRDLTRERELQKLARAREKEINDAPNMQTTDFWCDTCRRDFIATGYKSKKGTGNSASAMYLAACPNGHGARRHITDIWNDPYFKKSLKVRADQDKYADYLLSPHDDRFRIVYPNAWRELEARKEEYEQSKPKS